MTDRTLCFLIKKKKRKISEVCLGFKKKGFGQGLWAGIGGKVGDKTEEEIEEAAQREVREEIGVNLKSPEKAGEITFLFKYFISRRYI